MYKWKDKRIDHLSSRKLIGNFGAYSILFLALAAMTFFGMCSPQGPDLGPQGSAARVDDENISGQEFRRVYRQVYANMQSQFGESFNAAQLDIAGQAMDRVVQQRVLYQAALDLGLSSSEDEVIKVLQDAEFFKGDDGQFSTERFEGFLRGNGYSEKSFMEDVKRNLTVQKLRQFIIQSGYTSSKVAELEYKVQETKLNLDYLKFDPNQVQVTVTGEEIDAYLAQEENLKKVQENYDSHQDKYNTPEKVKARHILVSYKGARNAGAEAAKRSKEDAEKRAQEILARLQKDGGASFAKVAEESTDEMAGRSRGGDLGFFTREAMVKEFSDAAFALKPGEMSSLVSSPFGFHIIKVDDKQEAKITEFETAKRSIAEEILKKEKQPELNKARASEILELAQKGPEAQEALTSKLKDFGMTWQKTGLISASSRYIPGIGSDPDVMKNLFKLKKVGEVTPEPLEVRNSLFILKLTDYKPADVKKLDEEKAEQMAQTLGLQRGYAFYQDFEKHITKTFEDEGRIWRNPEFALIDRNDPNNSSSNSEEAPEDLEESVN